MSFYDFAVNVALTNATARKRTIQIPENATVFIVEDSRVRLQWFFERLAKARYSSTVEDALPMLSLLDEDAFLFLDHDLNWHDAAGRKPGSGVRIAHFLAKRGFFGRTVIHSVNEEGSAEMKRLLPQAECYPFGTFELHIGSVSPM
jgi:hypothetical protein